MNKCSVVSVVDTLKWMGLEDTALAADTSDVGVGNIRVLPGLLFK